MAKSKVYFTDMRTKAFGKGLMGKLANLLKAAGMDQIDFNGKFTAIKIHFGEPGNLSFLRPNFARVVADEIKKLGGKPFLTDCNTLYVGHRKDALDHIESAYLNGFTPYTTGCHVIIADGLKGGDETLVPVPNGGSRAGKMEQHCDSKPFVDAKLCVGCRLCSKICAHGAQDFSSGKAVIDHNKCVGCGQCVSICPKDAISASYNSVPGSLDKKMAEYAWAVLEGRPHFHISIVMDVSPFCDCHPENDAPIVSDVGMFASFDPVALDQACADAVNKMPALVAGSILGERDRCHHDHFKDVSPTTNWEIQLEHSEKLGIGTREYELITVK